MPIKPLPFDLADVQIIGEDKPAKQAPKRLPFDLADIQIIEPEEDTPGAGVAAPEAAPTPKAPRPSIVGAAVDRAKAIGLGIYDPLVYGAKTTSERVQATGRSLAGNLEGVEQDARDVRALDEEKPKPQAAFGKEIQRRMSEDGDDSAWQGVKNVAGAAAEEPIGAAQETLAQLPNMAPPLAGGLAGAKIGAALGSLAGPAAPVAAPVLGVTGFLLGMFAGNSAIEVGAKAIEKANDGDLTEQENNDAIREGLIKSGVITAVDGVTLGLSKLMLDAPGRAVERAVVGVLQRRGVNPRDGAAVLAARQNPEIASEMLQAGQQAYRAATGGGKTAGRVTGAMALESAGEGTGEYLGELAATGEASYTEAALEALMSLPMSATELAYVNQIETSGKQTRGLKQDFGVDFASKTPLNEQMGESLAENIRNAEFSPEGIENEAIDRLNTPIERGLGEFDPMLGEQSRLRTGPLTRAADTATQSGAGLPSILGLSAQDELESGAPVPLSAYDQNVGLTLPGLPPASVVEPEPEPERKPDPVPQNQNDSLPVVELPVSALSVSPDVPQFKEGANERGVVEPLGGKFDRRGVAPIQVWERADGRLEVISGRHRLDLADRSGEETIPAQVYREADGFSVEQARALDAELNIKDGQGKAIDYVDYFKSQGITEEQAKQEGLVARNPGRRAFALASSASESLIAQLRAGQLSDTDAEKIALAAPGDERLQAVAIDQAVNKGRPIAQAIGTMQAVQAMARERGADQGGGTGDLFGFDDSSMREAEEMGRIAAAKQAEITRDINAIGGASKRPELARKYGIDVKDPEAAQAKLKELRAERNAWNNWPTNPDLVQQVRQLLTGAPPAAAPAGDATPTAQPTAAQQGDAPAQSTAATREDRIREIDAIHPLKRTEELEAERTRLRQESASEALAIIESGGSFEDAGLSFGRDGKKPTGASRIREIIRNGVEIGYFGGAVSKAKIQRALRHGHAEQAPKKQASTIQDGDILRKSDNQPFADRNKAQLAARARKLTGYEPVEVAPGQWVLRKGDGAQEQSPATWTPENQVKIAADSIQALRRHDVERVLTDGIETAEQQQAMAEYIKTNRLDLTKEVDRLMEMVDVAISSETGTRQEKIKIDPPENRTAEFRAGWAAYFRGEPGKAPQTLRYKADRDKWEDGWESAKQAREKQARVASKTNTEQPVAEPPGQPEPVATPQAAPAFTPTHTASDGEPVRATETPGLYVNAQGIEVEDPAAEPIGAMSSVVDEATDLDLNAQPPGSKPAPPTDFNLEPETEEDIRAREEAQQQREKTEAEAKQKDEQKAKADAEVDSFSLTGSDRLEDTHGQGFMFDLSTGAVRPEASQTNASIDSILPPSPNESVDKDALFDDLLDQEFSDAKPAPQASGAQPQTPSNQSPRATPRSAGEAASSAASNVSEAFNEAASGLVDLFNPGGGTFNSGLIFNEETYAKAKPHFIAMASHLKGAATDVADLMRAIIRALREQFGMTKEGVANMKPYIIRFAEDIESGVINLEGQDNVQSSTADEERDRADGEGRADQSTADAAGSRASGEAGSNVEADEGEGQDGASGVGVPGARPPAVGGGSGSDVSSKDGTLGAPRDRQRRGGDGSGAGGLPSGSGGTTPTSSAAAGSSVRVDLDAASKVSIKTADAENIKASLPQLLESQREDVLFAENRFKNGGRGVLFTNGTGTGKTFSGLGIIARQVRQGKGNILITVPGEKIAADWIKAAKQFFNIDIHQLANTQDAGPAGSVVITTYANFGQNNNLAKREWDMLVHDEAHYLSSSKSGDATAVLKTSRALTGHPRGASAYAEMMESKLLGEISDLKEKIRVYSASDSEMMWRKAEELRPRLNTLIAQMEEREAVHTANRARTWEAKQTRRLDLSATPFAYHASVDAAEGFLFDYGPEPDSSAYNTPSASDQFMIEHFGYRMRTGKLTKPDASVDQSIMERQFNRWLNQQGALSGRMLDVDFDYSREFVAVESLIGNKIDDGLSYIKERSKDKKDPLAFGYAALAGMLERSLDYHQRVRLLEAIKAPFAVERANQHIAMGRKVVIFHSRIQGGATHPFRFERLPENNENSLYNATIDDFIANRPDLYELDLGDLARPLDLFREAFGDRVTFYNGTINKKEKVANPAAFVEDDGPYDVIVVQDDAGKEGISLHDVTGKHPRALINIGLPIKPTQAIQIEGRIYRVGQQSNAIFEYFNTGTSFERWTFATKIAERASTAENLAMGDSARKLRDAFVDAFDNPTEGGPQQEQGLGGKVRDRAAYEPLSGFEEAKTHYFGNQKNNKSRSNREGVDYYATPEPIGFKMVEWSGIRPNESALEPSAGHGAIARYFPGHARSTFVEPSGNLISRLALRASGSLRQHQFEDLDEASNKYDAIIMNPPYGQGGATARDHLAKAMNHLKNGGRIVALLPDGPSANQKIEALLYGKDGESASSIKDQLKGATGERAATLRKRLNQLENFHLRAEFGLPAVTFGRAGTTVKTRVLVIDRVDSGYQGEISQRSRRDIDADTINDLFDAIENMAVPDRLSDVKPAEEVLANFGLKLKQIQDGDNLVYELSGNTYQNRSAVGPVMRKHGGRFVKGPKIWTASSDPSSDLARALQGLPVDGLEQEQSTPDEAKPGIIEHVTQAGKTIRGVVAKGITQSQAKAIDPWTFKKNGGWFIRERHLDEQGRYPGQPGWGSLDEGGSQDVRFSRRRADTITVDGVERSRTNSEGKPIHPTEEGIRNFWRWFGDSKVVDNEGRPLVVHHLGSPFAKGRSVFEPGGEVLNNQRRDLPLSGTSVEMRSGATGYASGPGIWFGAKDGLEVGTREWNRAGGNFPEEPWSTGPATYSAYLALKNPLVITSNKQRLEWKNKLLPYPEGARGRDTGFRPDFPYRFDGNQRKQLVSLGYDGVILSIPDPTANRDGREWIAFESAQIKSAIGNTGAFNPSNPDIRFSFAGQGAKTADTMALSTAQARLDAGENPETVRQQTGWFKGDDGKWRFEINDDQAKLTDNYADFKGIPASLTDVLDHPALFAAYPRLSNIGAFIEIHPSYSQEGSYNSNTGIIIAKGPDKDVALSVLLHEIQHNIQRTEGFATGGSPGDFAAIDSTYLVDGQDDKLLPWTLRLTLRHRLPSEMEMTGRRHQVAFSDAERADLIKQWRKHSRQNTAKANRAKRATTKQEYAEAAADIERSAAMLEAKGTFELIAKDTTIDKYHRLAGETEARNTQARQSMTAEERRATSPEATRDVPASDVIVMFNGQEANLAPTPANAPTTTLSPTQVRSIAHRVVSKWATKVPVQVLPSVNDSRVPQAIRDAHAGLDSKDVVDGVLYDGTVYLFSDAMQSPEHVIETLFHEALGHYGMRGIFGSKLVGILDQIVDARYGDVLAKGLEYKLATKGEDGTVTWGNEDITPQNAKRQAAEEVLAEMAQTRPEIGFVKRVIAAIRQWIRQNMPALAKQMAMTDADIIANFILPARRYVEGRGGRGKVSGISFARRSAASFGVPGLDPVWRNLTPAERAKLRRDTSERLVSIFRSLPTEAEMASVALAGKAKRGWYRHSGEAIVHVFGPDAPRFAILLSALSPKVSVQENMRNALHVWKGWLDAGRPTDPQIINEILETAVPLVDDDGSRAIMDAWKNNAIRALSSAVPENVILSGPKVDSFYRNLVGIVNEVTNDAWMAIFAAVDQKIFGGSLTKTDPGKGPGYLAMSAKVRATARRLSKMTGETWTPAEVQETIWSWAKTLYEFSKTQGRTALDIIENNELTDAMIAATPDFRSLFHEDTYQDILAQAGYGERLRTLRDPRQDYAGAGDQAGGANSQADAAAPSPQKRHLQQAAKRIDKVKAQRQAQAQAQAQARAQAQAASPSESPDVRFSRRSPRTSSLGPLPQPPIPPRQQNAYQRTIARIDKLTDPESFDNLIYVLQDQFIDLKRLQTRIDALGGIITDRTNAYQAEELYHKRVAYRTDEFLAKELRPLLQEMNEKKVSTEEFETYLHARHAPEANKKLAERNPNQDELDVIQDTLRMVVNMLSLDLQNAQTAGTATKAIEQSLAAAIADRDLWDKAQPFKGTEEQRLSLSGMSDADAQAYMAGLAPEVRVKMEDLAVRVDAMNETTLQLMERYDLEDRATINGWRETYDYYVPLHRDEAHPDTVSHPMGQGFQVRGHTIQQRVGSNSKVTNILAHIAMQREVVLTRGEKGRVAQHLYALVKANPLPGVWSVNEVPMLRRIDPKTGIVKTYPDRSLHDKPNIFVVRAGGKELYITFNEHNPQAMRLAATLKNLDGSSLDFATRNAAVYTRFIAKVNTQYNPIFGFVNLARDVQAAGLQLSTTPLRGKQGAVLKGVIPAMRAIWRVERAESKGRVPGGRRALSASQRRYQDAWIRMQMAGGSTGYRDLYTRPEDRTIALHREIKRMNSGMTMRGLRGLFDWLSDFNETLENCTRVAAFVVANEQMGMSVDASASLSKNLTVNFNKKGAWGRSINAWFVFFNAAVQGLTRMGQTLAGPSGKLIMAGGITIGIVNTLAGMLMIEADDDDEDDETFGRGWFAIPEFIRERNFVIPNPASEGGYFTFPMPLGYHIFPNIGRKAIEIALGHGVVSDGQHVADMLGILADAFNPLGGSDGALQMLAPTPFDIPVALATNQDWTGRPITPPNFSGLDPDAPQNRVLSTATPWAKAGSEKLNKLLGGTDFTPSPWAPEWMNPTPDQIDYVIGQLTGGVGREFGKAVTTAMAPFNEDELPWHKVPLLGRFIGNVQGPASQSSLFYEHVKKLNGINNEIEGRIKRGDDRADILAYAETQPLVKYRKIGAQAQRQVSKLRRHRRMLAESKPEGWRDEVKRVDERITAVMTHLNKLVMSETK